MKILHIIDSLSSGGAEKLICDLSLEMIKDDNVKVDILLLTDKGNVHHTKLKNNNIKIEIVPLKRMYNPMNIFHLRNYIVQNKYDIVHVHLFPANYWTSLASKTIIFNKPIFITTEHSTYNRRRSIRWLRNFEKEIYKSFDSIVSISEEAGKNLKSWLKPIGKSINKFVVIKNGINLEEFYEADKLNKGDLANLIPGCDKLLCMVGRFSDSKDHNTLLEAMRIIPENVGLILVGEGQKLELIKNKVAQYKLNHRIVFLGFRNDVSRILKTVDVVILSSNWEGFGLAAVEGMAAGKPVIASDVKGLNKIVGGAGILFEKGNKNSLSDAVINLLSNGDEYNKISTACKARAEEYSLQKTSNQYLHLYRSFIEKYT